MLIDVDESRAMNHAYSNNSVTMFVIHIRIVGDIGQLYQHCPCPPQCCVSTKKGSGRRKKGSTALSRPQRQDFCCDRNRWERRSSKAGWKPNTSSNNLKPVGFQQKKWACDQAAIETQIHEIWSDWWVLPFQICPRTDYNNLQESHSIYTDIVQLFFDQSDLKQASLAAYTGLVDVW